MSNPLHSTAIHEAGHAVAHFRLFGVDGRMQALSIRADGGGDFTLGQLDEITPGTCRSEAIVYYSGWAAVLAHGYSEEEAERGTAPDFATAINYCADAPSELKEEARSLMRQPENIHAVTALAGVLLEYQSLDGNCVRTILIEADERFRP